MTWAKFNVIIGKLTLGRPTQKETEEFLSVVQDMIDLLDEGDMEDAYGTEGWKHRLGLED